MFTTYRVPPAPTNPNEAAARPLAVWFEHLRVAYFGKFAGNIDGSGRTSGHAAQGC